MATRFFLVTRTALAAVAGSVAPARAQWIPNGVPVCTAAGVYLVRLKAGSEVQVRRLVRLR